MTFKSSANNGNECVGVIAIVFALAITAPIAMWWGYVLSVMWGWFLVPLGAPEIGVAHAIGIAGLVAMMAKNSNASKDYKSLSGKVAEAFVAPLVTLAIGWVAKTFM